VIDPLPSGVGTTHSSLPQSFNPTVQQQHQYGAISPPSEKFHPQIKPMPQIPTVHACPKQQSREHAIATHHFERSSCVCFKTRVPLTHLIDTPSSVPDQVFTCLSSPACSKWPTRPRQGRWLKRVRRIRTVPLQHHSAPPLAAPPYTMPVSGSHLRCVLQKSLHLFFLFFESSQTPFQLFMRASQTPTFLQNHLRLQSYFAQTHLKLHAQGQTCPPALACRSTCPPALACRSNTLPRCRQRSRLIHSVRDTPTPFEHSEAQN